MLRSCQEERSVRGNFTLISSFRIDAAYHLFRINNCFQFLAFVFTLTKIETY